MSQSDLCLFCKHYQENAKCDAFPDGIPEDIFSGEFDQHNPYPGDHGIQFEAA
jgi:hypothetical protein